MQVHRYLKDFTTTKADAKKQRFKIPEEEFRLKEEDTLGSGVDEQEQLFGSSTEKKRSKTLYQKEEGPHILTLDDFKIIKILGKGSFGKA
jgi:hypothetical protein